MEHIRELVTELAFRNPSIKELQFVRDDPDTVEIIELPNGYINFTFRILSPDRMFSVIVKHYKDHLKSLPSMAFSLERMESEFEALKLFHSIVPGNCPQPYCLDKKLNTVVMEDLKSMALFFDRHQSLDAELMSMERLAKIVASVHSKTAKYNVTSEQWSHFKSTFNVEASGTLTDRMIATSFQVEDPLMELEGEMIPMFESLISNPALLDTIAEIRNIIKQEQCVIHGDCHDRSVLLDHDRCVVFDMELTRLSHRAVDLSFTLSNIVVIHYILAESDKSIAVRSKFKQAARIFLKTYSDMTCLEGTLDIGEIMAVTAGLTAVFIFRTSNHVLFDELFTMGATKKQRAELMRMGAEILNHYKSIRSYEQFIETFF